MTDAQRAYVREYNQRYHLPRQLDRARAKVRALEHKAALYGMTDLLQPENRA